MRRFLVATDFSCASAAAFRAAVEWARRERAELVLAHVVEPSVIEPTFLSAEERRDFARFSECEAERALRPLTAKARRAGVLAVHGWRGAARHARRDGGELTPGQKVKRAAVSERYRDALDALYR